MTQLHCYVPDSIAQQAQRRTNETGFNFVPLFGGIGQA